MGKHQLPAEIPDFFADVKIDNWGMIGDRAVCHDYANHSFFSAGKIGMTKPDWWSDPNKMISGNGTTS